MGSLSDAAPIVQFAFVLGVVVSSMTLLTLVATIAMRMNAVRSERIDARAEALWRPILVAARTGAKPELPRLVTSDLAGFGHAWNEAHEPLHGGSTEALATIAREVNALERLGRRLKSSRFQQRVMAVIALGHIKNAGSFNSVLPLLNDKSPIISLCAARSLMQIDPARAVPKVVPLIVDRAYWPQGVVAALLRETDESVVAEPLVDATLHATSEVAPRMIRFLAGVNPESAAPIIRAVLHSSTDEHIVSACLQAMTNAADVDCVRPLLSHRLWYIRMQAAATLGRLGVRGDDQRLTVLLSDSQWWVRYRAAQALLRLSFIREADARRIQEAQTDAYARDILDHVLAERAIAEAVA